MNLAAPPALQSPCRRLFSKRPGSRVLAGATMDALRSPFHAATRGARLNGVRLIAEALPRLIRWHQMLPEGAVDGRR